MKICVSIDSESYTTLYADKVDSVDEAVRVLREREGNPDANLEIEDNYNGSTRITLTKGEDYFVVAQVFDIPTERYAAVWWHAYDGVDFKIAGTSNNWSDAMEYLYKQIDEWKEDAFETQDYCEGDTSALVDTGVEWERIEIVDLAETVTLVVENPLGKPEEVL